MARSSCQKCVFQLCIIINVIVLAASQGHLTATERRILEGFSDTHNGQVHVLDNTNVLEPNSHVDLPGVHGNQSPHPVVHRKTGSVDTTRRHINEIHHGSSGNAHVDLPGQHGNQSPVPIVHRENHITGIAGHQPQFSTPERHSIDIHHGSRGNAHVDLPGQHGNQSPVPIVHRENHITDTAGHQPHFSTPERHSIDLHHGSRGNAHVDLPGQHGNQSPVPIVHRESHITEIIGNQPSISRTHRQNSAHIDLPGHHGNDSPHPAVHRETGSHGSHVDLPGEHGNHSPLPTVHRDGFQEQTANQHNHISHDSRSSQFIDPVSGTPVMIPGQNNGFEPILQRQRESVHGPNRIPFDSSIGARPAFFPRRVSHPIDGPSFIQGHRNVDFPGYFFPDMSVRGPFVPERFGQMPIFVPPRRIRPMRRLIRRRMLMGGFPPPYPPLPPSPLPPPSPPPPRRIGLRGILAGVIGSLLGNLFRQ